MSRPAIFRWRCGMCRTVVPGYASPRGDNPSRVCARCVSPFGPVLRHRRARYGDAERSAVFGGVDFEAERDRLFALPFVPEALQRRPPDLCLVRARKVRREVGRARYDFHVIEVVVGPRCGTAFALSTLVHEVAHYVRFPSRGHGKHFRMQMDRIVRDAYAVEPEVAKGGSIYLHDDAITDALAKVMVSDRPGAMARAS